MQILAPEQASNLAIVAIGLLSTTPPPQFRMRDWATVKGLPIRPEFVEKAQNECGTACCFAGHGPIFLKNSTRKWEEWRGYVNRVFIAVNDQHPRANGLKIGIRNFLFSSSWKDDRQQAARRALMVLESKQENLQSILDGDYWYQTSYLTKIDDHEVISRLEVFITEQPADLKPQEYFPGDAYFKPGLRPCRGRI